MRSYHIFRCESIFKAFIDDTVLFGVSSSLHLFLHSSVHNLLCLSKPSFVPFQQLPPSPSFLSDSLNVPNLPKILFVYQLFVNYSRHLHHSSPVQTQGIMFSGSRPCNTDSDCYSIKYSSCARDPATGRRLCLCADSRTPIGNSCDQIPTGKSNKLVNIFFDFAKIHFIFKL